MTWYAFWGRLLSVSKGRMQRLILRFWVPLASWAVNLGVFVVGFLVV